MRRGFLIRAVAATAALAQPPARDRPNIVPERLTFDPCPIAPLDQFRFLITTALARALPTTRTADGNRVTLTILGVTAVTCTPMRAELRGVLERQPLTSDSSLTPVQFVATMLGEASFQGDSARTARTPSTLSNASLCVGDLELGRSERQLGPTLDHAKMRIWLSAAMRDQCFEITSLVYVYLQRGGTLTGPR